MSFWVLLQILVDIVLLAGVIGGWFKLQRPQKDDPRMSRGLQLLQSKISVLEDLSDRTETQVHQLTALMEQKCKEIQAEVLKADRQIQEIDLSMNRSMEVAKIFQDKIPHQEIIERQNTIKYVKAARMAHQGASVTEISQAVDLTRGEIDFIAKVNRDQLQFSESDLPEWAKEEGAAMVQTDASFSAMPLPEIIPAPPIHAQEVSHQALSQLGEQFRKALGAEPMVRASFEPVPPATVAAKDSVTRPKEMGVRKVVFPKIDISKNLG